MDLVECKKLSKNFGSKKVLDDISFTIGKGKIVGLLGPNGSGKTTLIKLLNDLLVPTSGEVLIAGFKPGIDTKKIVSYLPDKTYLNQDWKVIEVIEYFKDFYEDFDENKAKKLLKRLDINENDQLKVMSKGTKEKVQLVLTMSRKAKLYILDEPIGGVDPASRDYILDTILTNFNEEASILISTHLISDIERVLDEVIFLNKGKITRRGSCDELRKKEKKSMDEIFREEFKC